MALEESRKRKTPDRDSQYGSQEVVSVSEDFPDEPEAKLMKLDDGVQPNLKTVDSEDFSENLPSPGGDNVDVTDPAEAPVDEPVTEATVGPEAAKPAIVKPATAEPTGAKSPCSISIRFQNQAIADYYKTKFLEFLHTFVELEIRSEDDLNIEVSRDECLKPKEWTVVDEAPQAPSASESPSKSPSKKRKKKAKAKRELFMVDAKPSGQPTLESMGLRYTSKFTLSAEAKAGEEEKKVGAPSRQTCFNCDQAHALKDCPTPRDYGRINAARQKFIRQPKSSRYHLEEDQKFGHLAPGRMSDELRKALGLHRNELPHFVYLMRRLGYPPGWLEEAKFLNSNLDMFDIDGKHVKESSAKKRGLDPDRIVDYPGFNVPLEDGMKDDYRAYGVPPYSDDFSKEAMIRFFEQQCAKEQDDLESCDMDVEDATKTVPEAKALRAAAPEAAAPEETDDSLSLPELEKQKLQLLEELNVKVDSEKAESDPDYLSVKTSSFGTPILKSSSPFMRLPNPDNFMKDVSPVINFENLPNSTGKYEQMTDVLQKVRTTLKGAHNCNT